MESGIGESREGHYHVAQCGDFSVELGDQMYKGESDFK